MKKNEINLAEIEKLLDSLSDDDIDILSIEFTENKKLVLYMKKTLSTVHTIDKQASIDKLMALISKIENYSEIDE